MRFKRQNQQFKGLFILLFMSAFLTLFSSRPASAAVQKVKIRYNGKTYQNSSTKLPVTLNGRTVSKKGYHAIKIKGYYMVSYADVFRSGAKIECTYKNKKLTMTGNQNTLKMKVGSKSATLNGKKITLKAAPLSVRYMSKKKTKILIPIKEVAKNLGYTFFRSDTDIQLLSPLSLQYNKKESNYHDVQGKIYYNHAVYSLSTLPVIKLDGKYYIPAQEVVEKILGWDYRFESSSGNIIVENEDLNISIHCQVGSKTLIKDKKEYAMSVPVYIVKNKADNSDTVCIPAADFLKYAGYTRGWKKDKNYYSIQSSHFFSWNQPLTDAQKGNTAVNYIYQSESTYEEEKGTGAVKLQLTGSSADIMKTLTVKRSNSTITITLPSSQYILDKKQFSNFGEIIDKLEVTSGTDGNTNISLSCQGTADYSYTVQDGVFLIRILYTYSNEDGSVINHSLSIPKPDGIKESDVTNQDMYPKSKSFKIFIKGDYVDYFKNNPVIINNNTVKSVSVSKSGSNTAIHVKTSKLRGYKIYVKNQTIVVSMGEPKKMYKSIVVLDPGHGGYDPGAQNKGVNEKDLNFKMLYTLMKPYFSSNAPDIKAYWTRTDDSYITLADRAAFAKKVSADIFISLHMNSAANNSANGTEVYYSVSNNGSSFSGITSKKMAAFFKTQLIQDLGTKNRGTKTAAYYVLKHNTVPAVLIELGFISGNTDFAKLKKESFQKKAAKSIYNGIKELFKQYPTKR